MEAASALVMGAANPVMHYARTVTSCRLGPPQYDIVIDSERATTLFRIFQQTLTNVARHANATEVHVRLAEYALRNRLVD